MVVVVLRVVRMAPVEVRLFDCSNVRRFGDTAARVRGSEGGGGSDKPVYSQ